MLFSSLIFILGFLPVALSGFFLTARLGRSPAAAWLIGVSLVFYGCWNPSAVILLLASIGINYAFATLIILSEQHPARRSALTLGGVAFNLLTLFYYKYLFAIAGLLHGLAPAIPAPDPAILPLGISFFTFTQIGYLIDRGSGGPRDRGLLNYVLFVTFFPHLIAGPILHNKDIMPQFADPRTYRLDAESLSVGVTIFVIGLLKKTVCADPLASWVSDGYADTAGIEALAAWNLALCYSLQLYFDFSGYSDMAIGLARMMNVRFPRNFDSPYKARDIIAYWQRWHITLTDFLTTYLFSPMTLGIMRYRSRHNLGVGRAAQKTAAGFASMVALPLLLTMTLAGIWHGSGLTFVIFGALHGSYLCICHAWRLFRPNRPARSSPAILAQCGLTYLCVLIASVFFRAPSVSAAFDVLVGMAAGHGLSLPAPSVAGGLHLAHIAGLYAIVWLCPNTQQIMSRYRPVLGDVEPPGRWGPAWSPNRVAAMAIGCGATIGILALGGTTEFLYFQF